MKIVVQILAGLSFLLVAMHGKTHTEDVGYNHGDMIVSQKSFSYSELAEQKRENSVLAPVDIDIFFMFTEGAKNYLGGDVSDVDEYIDSQIEYLNLSFNNSSLEVTARNAGVKSWHYDFDPDSMKSSEVHGRFVPLTVIVPSSFKLDDLWPDGIMSDHGADVIVVIKALEDNDSQCGFARVPNHEQLANEDHNQQVAILNVASGCQRDSLLAHELGHLLGSVHEDFDVTNDDYPDARAYGCGNNNTILHSDPTGRVPYFSDPDLILDGLACGDSTNANNKRVFAVTSALLGGKTNPIELVGSVTISASKTNVEEGETIELTIERDGDFSEVTSLELGLVNVSTQASDYSIAVDQISFRSGEASKVVEVNIIDDTSTESEETLTIYVRNLIGLSKGQNSEITLTVAASDETITHPDPVEPGGSSGGGALGVGILALIFGSFFRRRAS